MMPIMIKPGSVKYDVDHDVLHVFFPPSVPSFDDEELPGIIIKRSANDERITGLVILDYSKRDGYFLKNVLPRFDFSKLLN